MQKVKSTIPLVDICSLHGQDHLHNDIIAEPFATYLLKHPNLTAPHRHTFYHLVLFTMGSGYHTVDFERFPVTPGQVYFMAPGQVHSWNFDGPVDGYIVNFSASILQQPHDFLDQFTFFRSVAAESVINLPTGIANTVTSIIARILNEVSIPQLMAAEMVGSLLTQLFVTVQRQVTTVQPGPLKQNQLILHNFRQLLNQHYMEKHLPREYAAMLYITPNHLNAVCNEVLGKPAGEVIRDRILLEAKRLLVNGNETIAGIAYRLSFTDNSYFTRFFRKYTGQTPEEFKRTSLAK